MGQSSAYDTSVTPDARVQWKWLWRSFHFTHNTLVSCFHDLPSALLAEHCVLTCLLEWAMAIYQPDAFQRNQLAHNSKHFLPVWNGTHYLKTHLEPLRTIWKMQSYQHTVLEQKYTSSCYTVRLKNICFLFQYKLTPSSTPAPPQDPILGFRHCCLKAMPGLSQPHTEQAGAPDIMGGLRLISTRVTKDRQALPQYSDSAP